MSPQISSKKMKQEMGDNIEVSQAEMELLENQTNLTIDQSQYKSFSYETVVKEELIIEDEFETFKDDDLAEADVSKTDRRRKFHSLRCDECDKTFEIAESFYCHMNRHKNFKARKYVCEYCQRPFMTSYNLKNHERNFHRMHLNDEEKPPKLKTKQTSEVTLKRDESGLFKCPECDKGFQKRSQYMRHVNTHVAKKQARFQCELCKRCFGSRADLGNHLLTHEMKDAAMFDYTTEHQGPPIEVKEDDGLFKCSKCNKKFKERFMCVRHIWRHNLQKPTFYPCGTCKKKFKKRSNLLRHEGMHEAAKSKPSKPPKFHCEMCQRPFQKRWNLIRHYHVIHDKEKAWAKEQTLKEYLALREKEKTEHLKPEKQAKFRCEKCEKCFRKKSNLTRHHRLIHKKEAAKDS